MKDFGYILNDNRQLILVDMMEYFRWWMEAHESSPLHVVGKDHFGDVEVSTVFLMAMHLPNFKMPAFETMVFLPNGGTGMVRKYQSWEDAEAGHKEVVLHYKMQIQ